jgi:transcriptional regulator with XRE-family HTH domain
MPLFPKKEDEENRKIREKVKELRLLKGMTQEELAWHIGKSQKNYSDLERGRTEISASDLMYIATQLQTPIRYLLPVNVPEGEITADEWEILRDYRRMWREENQDLARKLMKEIADRETEQDLKAQKQEAKKELAKAGIKPKKKKE